MINDFAGIVPADYAPPTSQTPKSVGFFSAMAKLWGVGGLSGEGM
jgi:hypothetical protein